VEIIRLSLPTRDLDATARFYGETLGLPTSTSTDRLNVTVGPSTIEFQSGDATPQHFAFNVRRPDFLSAKEWLSERVPLHQDSGGQDEFEFAAWHARASYFFDPDGNILEIIGREDRVLPSSGHPLAEVSEAAVACADVRAALAACGLPAFREPVPDFAAAGDDQGLLILVSTERLFYPDTGIPARPVSGFVEYRASGVLRMVDLATAEFTVFRP